MKTVFMKTAYNHDTNRESDASALLCPEPTLTQQHYRDECDINEIVRRFGLTGELPEHGRPPEYRDFEAIYDYHSAMNAITAAQQAFAQMPAEVRYRFRNDPGSFVDFCNDPANLEEATALGLTNPKTEINQVNQDLKEEAPLKPPKVTPKE